MPELVAPVSLRPPTWLALTVTVLAVVGGLLTLLAGLLIFLIRMTPDTGRGEDIGVPIAIALLLPPLLLGALLGLGAGIGGVPLTSGRGRSAPIAAITLTLLGLAAAVVPHGASSP